MIKHLLLLCIIMTPFEKQTSYYDTSTHHRVNTCKVMNPAYYMTRMIYLSTHTCTILVHVCMHILYTESFLITLTLTYWFEYGYQKKIYMFKTEEVNKWSFAHLGLCFSFWTVLISEHFCHFVHLQTVLSSLATLLIATLPSVIKLLCCLFQAAVQYLRFCCELVYKSGFQLQDRHVHNDFLVSTKHLLQKIVIVGPVTTLVWCGNVLLTQVVGGSKLEHCQCCRYFLEW